jgi:CO/xanthine dehydrogenase Mo-binding subunit
MYRNIRQRAAPKAIDVNFVDNGLDPPGLGEPAYPPVFAALAKAIYKSRVKRLYHQPFVGESLSVNRM